MDTREKIINIITEIIKNEKLNINFDIEEEWNHNINSIRFVRLVVEIEKQFDIEFEDEFLDYNKFISFKQLYEYVEKRKMLRRDEL